MAEPAPASSPVAAQMVRCPRCRKMLDLAAIKTTPEFPCPACSRTFEAVRFSPRITELRVSELATAGPQGGQPCSTHARNAAVASCERCGAFMCGLCRIDVDGAVLCPPCFERRSAEGSIQSARTRFRDYDGLASVTATAGCLFSMMFLGILFGPLAIFYGVKALRQKKEFGETDGRTGVWIAMVIGIVEALVGIFMIGSVFV